jgi:hypothetical protein
MGRGDQLGSGQCWESACLVLRIGEEKDTYLLSRSSRLAERSSVDVASEVRSIERRGVFEIQRPSPRHRAAARTAQTAEPLSGEGNMSMIDRAVAVVRYEIVRPGTHSFEGIIPIKRL